MRLDECARVCGCVGVNSFGSCSSSSTPLAAPIPADGCKDAPEALATSLEQLGDATKAAAPVLRVAATADVSKGAATFATLATALATHVSKL